MIEVKLLMKTLKQVDLKTEVSDLSGDACPGGCSFRNCRPSVKVWKIVAVDRKIVEALKVGGPLGVLFNGVPESLADATFCEKTAGFRLISDRVFICLEVGMGGVGNIITPYKKISPFHYWPLWFG